MRIRHAAVSLVLVTALYLAALLLIDSKRDVFVQLPRLSGIFPVLFGSAAICWMLRFARWHLLLQRAGYGVALWPGLLAYVAGFAFTATPGKLGELVRIRYLGRCGVPAARVVAAFVYERALDLLVMLSIACMVANALGMLPVVAVFAGSVVCAVVMVARSPQWLTSISDRVRARNHDRVSSLIAVLGDGVTLTGAWMNRRDLVVSLALGAAAWSVQSLAFVWLLDRLAITVDFSTAFAIFPLAQLAGAASMLPGGIGSTEAVVVAVLVAGGGTAAASTLAAVGMRIATLWGAIVWGLAALCWLEGRPAAQSGP